MLKRITYGLMLWLCCCASLWAQEEKDTSDQEGAPEQQTLPEGQTSRDSVLHLPVTNALPDSLGTPSQAEREAVGNVQNEALIDSLLNSTEIAEAIDSLVHTKQAKVEPFVPDPIRSLWLALILPGAGQIYNNKVWKLPIVYGGFLGCVYALSWNGLMLRDYSQAYLDIMDDDPNTKSYEKMLPLGYNISGREQRFKDIFKRKKNYYRKYRDMSLFAFAGVYLISVIDAYVDAELSSFDISRELGLRWEPTKMNEDNNLARRFGTQTFGVQCSLTF